MQQGLAEELVIVDVIRNGHTETPDGGCPHHCTKKVIREHSDAKDADPVVITAGAPQKPGESRLI